MSLAPWLVGKQRILVRAPINPQDRSTIVSIYPEPVNVSNPTLDPGKWSIEGGTYDKPSILVVGPSSWWKEMPDEQPFLEIVNHSIQIAESIVRDYCNGLLGCDMGGAMPGLFYVIGAKTVEQIKREHKAELDQAAAKQKNWYRELVLIADRDWARANGNPLAVGDTSRKAAQQLGMNKDWLRGADTEMIRCIACGVLNNSSVILCPNCKVVLDKERFEKLGLKFAS